MLFMPKTLLSCKLILHEEIAKIETIKIIITTIGIKIRLTFFIASIPKSVINITKNKLTIVSTGKLMLEKIISPTLFNPAIIATKKTKSPKTKKTSKKMDDFLNNVLFISLMLIEFMFLEKYIKFFNTKNKKIVETKITKKLKTPPLEKNTSISFPDANPAPIIEPNIKKIKPKLKYFIKIFYENWF